jgi:hypothetical protein
MLAFLGPSAGENTPLRERARGDATQRKDRDQIRGDALAQSQRALFSGEVLILAV